MVPFSERLQEARKCKGLKQKEVSEYLNIAWRTYQNYETGERRPNFEILVALADLFEVTTDYLLGRTDVPNGGNQ